MVYDTTERANEVLAPGSEAVMTVDAGAPGALREAGTVLVLTASAMCELERRRARGARSQQEEALGSCCPSRRAAWSLPSARRDQGQAPCPTGTLHEHTGARVTTLGHARTDNAPRPRDQEQARPRGRRRQRQRLLPTFGNRGPSNTVAEGSMMTFDSGNLVAWHDASSGQHAAQRDKYAKLDQSSRGCPCLRVHFTEERTLPARVVSPD